MKTNVWHTRISNHEIKALSSAKISNSARWLYVVLMSYINHESGLIEREISADGRQTNTYRRGARVYTRGMHNHAPGDASSCTGGVHHDARRGAPSCTHNISINRSNEHTCLESSNNDDIQTEKMVLSFPVKGNVKGWNPGQTKLNEWQELYPDMDVLARLIQKESEYYDCRVG